MIYTVASLACGVLVEWPSICDRRRVELTHLRLLTGRSRTIHSVLWSALLTVAVFHLIDKVQGLFVSGRASAI